MYPQAYIEYLVHFHGSRDYFECHEVLEEYWKKTNQKHTYWIGFIQLAVSLYHHRRKNYRGAEKLMEKAIVNLKNEKSQIEKLGINSHSLLAIMKERLLVIKQRKPYESINLPIVDKQLLNICHKTCQQFKLCWGKESDLENLYLINKHTLRDRSTVIEIRKQNKLNKNMPATDERG